MSPIPPQPHVITHPRPWYRRARFLAPVGTVAGFLLGVGVVGAGGSATPAATPAAATVRSTSTATTTVTKPGPTKTVTRTVTRTAKPVARSSEVQAVLNAWTNAGPQPDKQRAAMAKLRREWPTLADALDAATGTRPSAPVAARPTTAAPAPPAPAPDVYYANCSAVRAAGAAPLSIGEPGYRAGLDRDGDGVACE